MPDKTEQASRTPPFRLRCAKDLMAHDKIDLVAALVDIADTLWFDGNMDTEWDADTTDEIARVVSKILEIGADNG